MHTDAFMGDIKKNRIKEIAEYLDCGYTCYYNPKTDELMNIPSISDGYDDEAFELAFQPDLQKIKTQKNDIMRFEGPKSFQSFKIMEHFVDEMSDAKFKTKLSGHLQNRKPFQNFKHAIDHSEYKEEWFQFKQIELEHLVEQQWNFEMDKR